MVHERRVIDQNVQCTAGDLRDFLSGGLYSKFGSSVDDIHEL